MRKSHAHLLRSIILFLLASPTLRFAFPAIHDVSPGENIQAAVNQSVDSDTILIHDGIYQESVVLYGKGLTIGSLYLVDHDTVHLTATVITPDESLPDTQSCFIYAYGEPRNGRLVGLTLRGGRGTRNLLDDATVGGAVYIGPYGQLRSTGLSIESCVIDSCSAEFGGGIFALGLEWSKATTKLENCRISHCFASQFGGGIEALRCSLSVHNCTFELDSCVAAGGALLVVGSHLAIDSFVVERCGGQLGGAAFSDCSGSILNGVFSNNSSTFDWAVNDLHSSNCEVTISGCFFETNSSGLPAIDIIGNRPFRFIGNVLQNIATSLATGTLVTGGVSNGEIAYNIFRNNSNPEGGTIYTFQNARLRIHHNYLTGNFSEDTNRGSVLLSVSNGRPSFDSNFVVNNMGTTISIHPDFPVSIHAENNYWGDPTGPYHPTLNPNGQGDTLQGDSIFFIPWLTEPPDTAIPSSVTPRDLPTARTWELLDPFPNPFNSTLNIRLAGFADDSMRITLYNLLGREIATVHSGRLIGGILSYTFPKELATGIYFLRAQDRHSVQHKKILYMK